MINVLPLFHPLLKRVLVTFSQPFVLISLGAQVVSSIIFPNFPGLGLYHNPVVCVYLGILPLD